MLNIVEIIPVKAAEASEAACFTCEGAADSGNIYESCRGQL